MVAGVAPLSSDPSIVNGSVEGTECLACCLIGAVNDAMGGQRTEEADFFGSRFIPARAGNA